MLNGNSIITGTRIVPLAQEMLALPPPPAPDLITQNLSGPIEMVMIWRTRFQY